VIVKICGITNLEDAASAVAAGAHALGFNFYPRSPRYIRPAEARAIVRELPAHVLRVGVFVHEPEFEVARIMEAAGMNIAQIHHGALPAGQRAWRARSVDDTFSPADLNEDGPEAFLLDAPAPGGYGGTGRVFDWTRVPSVGRRIVLAGGLDASNVEQAIATVRPWGVDACSRLESAPGRKDHQRVREFIQAAVSSHP
jgi:phosphoribosylanthranilate isomerase